MGDNIKDHCFQEEGSNPPVCGVHNVLLVQSEVPIDPYAPYLGHVTGYVCPNIHHEYR